MVHLHYVALVISIILGAVGQILMKQGAVQSGSFFVKLFTNVYLIGGFGSYAFSTILWVYALSKLPLSYAYPMVSMGYVLVFGLSYFLFHEPINILRMAGLAVIVVGVVMISRS